MYKVFSKFIYGKSALGKIQSFVVRVIECESQFNERGNSQRERIFKDPWGGAIKSFSFLGIGRVKSPVVKVSKKELQKRRKSIDET